MATKSRPRSGPKAEPSDLVDAQLERYRSMRDFTVTAEPAGSVPNDNKGRNVSKRAEKSRPGKENATSKLPFVVQKHAASRLHYDFRLGWNGVLKSWAIAKGPSFVTKDKRLAVQVEDHPMEYGGFEGIIPQGQYGGGTVMLWDTGTWEPQPGHADVDAGLRDGSLKFTLHGKKLKGNWALIRMGGRAADAKKPNWLLIKEHDSLERGEGSPSVTDEAPDSALTGRSLEEIASNKDHVWESNSAAGKPPASKHIWRNDLAKTRKVAEEFSKQLASQVSFYPKEAQPDFIPPQLAMQAAAPIDQPGWIHELKLDGYRIEARKSGPVVRLFTRSGLDWTDRIKEIASEVTKLPVDAATLDGEVTVLADDGTTSFAGLQAYFSGEAKRRLTYFVFDLLHLNGHNLRGAELVKRKELLASVLNRTGHSDGMIRLSDHMETDGVQVFEKACALHAEGIVSKRASGTYTSGRTGGWLKVKCSHEQEFVVGGFTLPSKGSYGIGALLLGYYDGGGKLSYAGRTGTGFSRKTQRSLRDQLEAIRTKAIPFESLNAAARRGAVFVTPKLVAEVSFANWTADRLVRQAAFLGIREDKPAKDVRREEDVFSSERKEIVRSRHVTTRGFTAKVNAPGARKTQPQSAPESAPDRNSSHLTHPDKILDIESGLTKRTLADYYFAIADSMLPQIANRPLSLVRCPDGTSKPCFFQKHTNSMLPPSIDTIQIQDKKTGEPEPYITLSAPGALVDLAQIGVLEVHAWGSRNDDLEHPDRLVIDLDPDEAISWPALAASATEIRVLFKKLGLESFLKSTGGKGLHVVVPIVPEHDWPTIKQFAHAIALELERRDPTRYLTKMSKEARKGRIFVDYLRNERGATSVAAFSPRAKSGATVSLPLHWAELESKDRPVFHVTDFDRWKDRLKRDPWKNLPQSQQKIDAEKVAQLLKES